MTKQHILWFLVGWLAALLLPPQSALGFVKNAAGGA